VVWGVQVAAIFTQYINFSMWLFLALIAYILFAGLLTRPIPDARVYAFYTGILGVFAFLLAIFGFQLPAGTIIFLAFLAGAIFIWALFLFFAALRIGEVSRIGISLGGLVPFFTLFFVYIWTGEFPNSLQLSAFALLVVGSFVIILERFVELAHSLKKFFLVVTSAGLFGLYFALVRFLFSEQSFISIFILIKAGGALAALLFLFSPQVRKIIFEHKKSPPKRTGGIFIAKNIAGGVGALSLHFAISIARFVEVSLISALQGAQFVLVFFGVLFLTKKFPWIVKEKIYGEALVVKFFGTGLIVAGIIILALA